MYKISTKDGKIVDGKDEFFSELKRLKSDDIHFAYLVIKTKVPSANRMRRFFYTICAYISIQNHYPAPPPQDEVEAVATHLKEEFLPKRSLLAKFKTGSKLVQPRASTKNRSIKNWTDFLENITSYLTGQGYILPDSEEYNNLAEEHGIYKTKEYMIDKLHKELKAKTT